MVNFVKKFGVGNNKHMHALSSHTHYVFVITNTKISNFQTSVTFILGKIQTNQMVQSKAGDVAFLFV